MRIGEFAEKFGLNVSTVRFYVNHGLLVPGRKNEQYYFDRQCMDDMKTILQYKQYHFTIEEIQLLMFLEKTSRFKDDLVLELFAEILKRKHTELISEREELDNCIEQLQNEISSLPDITNEENIVKGIPFSFIPNLYCPHCQIPLTLDSASIAEGYLNNGELICSCGYKALIENGELICEDHCDDTPFKSFENVESVLAMHEQFSSNYRMLIEKAYIYMYNQIANRPEDPQMIMSGPFQFNFLLSFIEKLGKKNTYVIVDPSKKRIEKMRMYLSEIQCNIVFIAGDLAGIPIRKKSIDIYLDDYSLTNSIFTFNDFNAACISGLMKRHGRIAGIFNSYRQAPASLDNFRHLQPDFEPKMMSLGNFKSLWQQNGIEVKNMKSIGFTTKNEKDYEQDVIGEQTEILAYYAEKSSL